MKERRKRKKQRKKILDIKKRNLEVEIEKKKFEEEKQRDFFKNQFRGRNIFGKHLKKNKKKN